jgi:monoamine oxidase
MSIDTDLIVLGAGIAGLAAARAVTDAKRKVVVFEARQRIGGRIYTGRDYGPPNERGAELIHGEGTATFALAERAGLKLGIGPNNQSFFSRGTFYPSDAPFSKNVEGAIDMLAANFNRDCSLADASKALPSDMPADIREAAVRAFAVLEGARARELSMRGLAWKNADAALLPRNYFVLSGYDRLLDYLASDLDVRLDQVIERVARSEKGVEVATHAGNRVSARAIIITAPLAVLKEASPEFSPGLPPEKLAAIAAIPTNHMNKCILRFKRRCWPEFEYLESDRAVGAWWQRDAEIQPSTVVGFAADPDNRGLGELKEDEAIAMAVAEFAHIFGSAVQEEFLGGEFVNWSADPFARGGYSFDAVDMGDARRALAAPVDRTLFFAGEATCFDTDHATVHGAYQSGLRAAEEFLAAVN